MGFLNTASDTLFSVCSTVAHVVSTATDWIAYILHVNYVFVTKICATVCSIITFLCTVVDSICYVVFAILVYIFDFLSEVAACFYALLVLLWRIGVLVYKICCLVVTGIETLVLGLWNGGVLTCQTLHQSSLDVMETCESITSHIAMLVQDFIVYVCALFTGIGTSASSLVRGLWVGIGYIPATLASLPSGIVDLFCKGWAKCYMWVSYSFMGVTQETYVGIIICFLSYAVISKLVYSLHSNGLTLFFVHSNTNRRRNTQQTRERNLIFDPGFESDIDEADVNDSAENSAEDDGNNSDEDNDSDAHTELTLSDNDSDDSNSVGSESDVSLNSQTYSSEDSDHEIDIQLPVGAEHYSLRSRSSTPSRDTSKDLDHDDFEREIERERDKRKCVVCQDANKSVLILPCKHMCLCVTCANQIVRSFFVDRRICPLCRRRIETVMNVYV